MNVGTSELQHYQYLFDHNPDAAYLVDTEARFASVNPAAEELSGYTTDELLQFTFPELLTPEDRDITIWHFEKAIQGQSQRFETSIVRKNGTVVQLSVTAIPVFVEGRVEGVTGIAKDISVLRRTEQALTESRARKSSILEVTLDSIVMMDHQGRILEFNPAAEKAFGYTREQVIGKNMVELIVPQSLREKQIQGLDRYLEEGEARIIGKRVETTGMRADGSEFPIELTVTQIRTEGAPIFTAYLRDITERKAMENSLIVAKEEAENASRAKSDFLSRMSHELRTPLNAILGFAQLLEFDPLTPSQTEDVTEIIKAGHHLLELINEVLDLARIESGKLPLVLEEVEVDRLIEDCLTLLQPIADTHNIRLLVNTTCSTNEGLCLLADRTRIKQVLLNLMTNAIKYNVEDGTVELGCERIEEGMFRFHIIDTGIGIPPSELNAIFQPFYRMSTNLSIEGTGVGLTITKQLIELMGGRIGVRSEPGRGSHFWVDVQLSEHTLPCDVPDQDGKGPSESQASGQQKYTVLYVEDNPANLLLVSRIFSTNPSVQMISAQTAELGMQLARSCPPDLILLDINLPDLDGFQVLETLQAEPRTSAIPVIAISANAMPKDIEKGLQHGFVHYLTKPIDVEQFVQTVARVLNAGFAK